MITMMGNDIHYAIDALKESTTVAFASTSSSMPAATNDIHFSTILQENKEGLPQDIIITAMSFFSEQRNVEKAKVYQNAFTSNHHVFVFYKLCQASVAIDVMLVVVRQSVDM